MRYPIRMMVLFAFSGSVLFAQRPDRELIKDLRGEWLILDGGGGFRNFDDDPVNKIFFSIDASQFKGDFLFLDDDRPFGIFINQQLALEKDRGPVKLSLDSLSALYSMQLSISVFQPGGIRALSCRLLGPSSPAPARSEEHTSELQSPDHLVCRLLLEKKHSHTATQ